MKSSISSSSIFGRLFFLVGSFFILTACHTEIGEETLNSDTGQSSSDSLLYNTDWTFLTHGKAEQDYSVVFPQESVNKIEISMTAKQWSAIRTNMKSLYGYDFGARGSGGAVGGGVGGVIGGAGPGFPDTDPDYVDVLVKYNNKSWKNVGYRLKGNSSLADAWGQGVYKLPFRLNFDKFEDTYPGVKNQHFFGFKELSFSSGFRDLSLMREKLATDIFRLGGVASAQTAFYRVYIDFGAGSKYCGVYTAVEIPEDNMVKAQFGEEKGNIYKPESKLAAFVQSEFEKKNNETEGDYTDVKAFISALNSSLRSSNGTEWRKGLEAVFNVDQYLKFLAINNAIVNWDSYGNMAHNYYLYNHSVNKLTWIPWDHNESLSGSPGISGTVTGGQIPGGTGRNGFSLSMNEVAVSWPLVRYIADDAVYMARYKAYLKQFNDNVFTLSAMSKLIDKYNSLITPYAIGPDGEQTGYTYLTGSSSYTNAILALKTHVSNRKTLISSYVF